MIQEAQETQKHEKLELKWDKDGIKKEAAETFKYEEEKTVEKTIEEKKKRSHHKKKS